MLERTLRLHRLPHFQLESGEVLREVRQAYHIDGQLNAERDNLVVVFHDLAGSADAVGDWWRAIIGPGKTIDTTRYAVLCTNLLGSCYGTSWGAVMPDTRQPRITTRDMARLVHTLVTDELRVESVALAAGGSLGGMVTMEWVATFPSLTRAAVVFAAPAAYTAYAIAWNHLQRTAVKLAGERGMELARMIGTLANRTPEDLEERFGRRSTELGYEVQAYLSHQGSKLVRRFRTSSYLALLDAMDSHDVARGREGVAEALRAYEGHLIGVGIPGDRLFPEEEVQAWVEQARAEYRTLESVHGHDAFFTESRQVGELLLETLLSVAPLGARR